jgi:hypothetical protein
MRRVLSATILFVFITASWGHLVPGSLKFSRPGPYHPGDTLTISFGVDVPHGGCNVDLSLDGKKFTTLKSNISAPSKQTYKYKWTVGQDTSSKAKIRICQMGGSTPCTDADNVDRPSSGNNYVLMGSVFSIVASAPAALPPGAAGYGSAVTMAAPGALAIAFSLPSEGPVSLAAYDAQGREAALLLRDRFSAGSHRLSIFSAALRAHPGWILRLDAAGRSEAFKP